MHLIEHDLEHWLEEADIDIWWGFRKRLMAEDQMDEHDKTKGSP